jgi:hypothetical protein
MRFLICVFLLSTTFISAQNNEKLNPPNNAKLKTPKILPIKTNTESSGIFVIEPKNRAEDINKAFKYLQQAKPSSKISIKTPLGLIPNILGITTIGNGTIIILKTSTLQGIKYEPVFIEDVITLFYN